MFGLFAIGCARLSQQGRNETRGTPQTSRQPSLLPGQEEKRLVKKLGVVGQRNKNLLPAVAVLYMTQLKKSHVSISTVPAVSCVPTGHQPLQRLGFQRRKNLLLVCVCACAACGLGYLKRQNASALPPVSGNILAPLHGFNSRDMEYDLKADATSVRN